MVVLYVFFRDYVPVSDALHWHMMAMNFLDGKGLIISDQLRAYRTPLPGLYFAAIYTVVGISTLAVQAVNTLLGVITVGLAYDLVRRSFSGDAAIPAALLVAFWPTGLLYTPQLLSETLFVFLLMLALWLAWVFRTWAAIWLSLVGLVLGAATLTRQTGLIIAGAVGGWALWDGSFGEVRLKLLRPVMILFFLMIAILPWTVRNYLLIGKFIPLTSEGGSSLWIANNPMADGTGAEKVKDMPTIRALPEVERGAAYQSLAVQFIRENPAQFVRLSLRRLLYFWHLGYHGEGLAEIGFLLVYLPMLALACVGVWRGWEVNRAAALLLLTVPAALTLVHMFFLPVGRYRLPAEMVACLFAGLAISRIWERTGGFRSCFSMSSSAAT